MKKITLPPCATCRFLVNQECHFDHPHAAAVQPSLLTAVGVLQAVWPRIQDPTAPGCGHHQAAEVPLPQMVLPAPDPSDPPVRTFKPKR